LKKTKISRPSKKGSNKTTSNRLKQTISSNYPLSQGLTHYNWVVQYRLCDVLNALYKPLHSIGTDSSQYTTTSSGMCGDNNK